MANSLLDIADDWDLSVSAGEKIRHDAAKPATNLRKLCSLATLLSKCGERKPCFHRILALQMTSSQPARFSRPYLCRVQSMRSLTYPTIRARMTTTLRVIHATTTATRYGLAGDIITQRVPEIMLLPNFRPRNCFRLCNKFSSSYRYCFCLYLTSSLFLILLAIV